MTSPRLRTLAPVTGVVLVVVAVALVVALVAAPAGQGTGERRRTDRGGAATSATGTPTPAVPPARPGLPPVVPWDGTGFAPPVTVLVGDVPTAVEPWTSCYQTPTGEPGESSGVCADGAPGLDGRPLVAVGAPDEVQFSFPDAGWTFEATFVADAGGGRPRARSYPGVVTATSEHTFSLRPAGPAGAYRVDLFGRGPTGGDVATSIGWTTPADGPLPAPTGPVTDQQALGRAAPGRGGAGPVRHP